MRSRKRLIWISAIAGGLALMIAVPQIGAALLLLGILAVPVTLTVKLVQHFDRKIPPRQVTSPVCDYCGYPYPSHTWEDGVLTCPSVPAPVGERRKRAAVSQDVLIAVANRDGGKCTECGSRENLQYDHVIPFSQNGADTMRNLRLLCGTCNRRKGAKVR